MTGRVALGWLSLVALGAAALSSACNESGCDTSPESNPPADFRGGELVTTKSGAQLYRTSTADGAHLNFSAGAQFRVHHQLGGVPQTVQIWVSFSADGTKDGNEAIPSGNMAEIICVNEEYIHVRNDSCGEYWLRVVASDPAPPMTPGSLDSTCP